MYLYIDCFVVVVAIFKYQCLATNISYLVPVEGHNLLHWSVFMDIKTSIYLNQKYISRTFNYLSCHWIYDGLSYTTYIQRKKRKKLQKMNFYIVLLYGTIGYRLSLVRCHTSGIKKLSVINVPAIITQKMDL
jgi:hypothetical protein